MKAAGIDIGTTTITISIIDGESGGVLRTKTIPNGADIKTSRSFEHIQDPREIYAKTKDLLSLVSDGIKLCAIGITGQMHGVLYVSREGLSLSPLYTWKDARSDQPFKNGQNYTQYLSGITDSRLAAGYGCATHFYNMINGLVPEHTAGLCTIHDYVAMRLCGGKNPVIHNTNAASFGLFNVLNNSFEHEKMKAAGIDPDIFPFVSNEYAGIGETDSGAPVFVAIGDNQASFMGSVRDTENSILVNVGTGSQVSLFSSDPIYSPVMEMRPFPGGYLLVGSSLCGGAAYSLLEEFFKNVVKMAGFESGGLYRVMDALSENYHSLENKLEFTTLFCGTREEPRLRASINNLSANNFTPRHFVVGVLSGIVKELYGRYEDVKKSLPRKRSIIAGSGNGIRKSPVMRQMFSEMFDMRLVVPLHAEEAAYGAALFALVGAGFYKTIGQAQAAVNAH